jgi:hypothetical protein
MLMSQSSVYVHDDRLEVGQTDPTFNETLSRVAYRDAKRLVAWTSTRRVHLWLGVASGLLGLLLTFASLAASSPEGTAVLAVLAGCALLFAATFFAMGRPGGITRYRVEGARGHVEGVLAGTRRKREALLREIAERIHARQAASSPGP